ncbi:helix-turn-helix domain-containing protein [Crossiella sp. CA198]|uniref:helix-turn-helix transcriptional regulator n=1 Tax=Crossiella sp. CA198 TaxID=3455607 RepID=UPI003F8D4C09
MVGTQLAPGKSYAAAVVELGGAGRTRMSREDEHGHDLVHVFGGIGQVRSGAAISRLEQGDVLFLRAGVRHTLAAAQGEVLSLVLVSFPDPTWRAFADLAGLEAGRWVLDGPPPQVNLRYGDGTVPAAFRRVLAGQAEPARPMDLVRLWVEALPPLERALRSRAFHPVPDWLTQACVLFSSEEHLRAGVPGLLALASVSAGHLTRSMHKHYQCTPSEFVDQRRLAYAAMLLSSTRLPVGAVAKRCGFNSQSYFARRFRERHGCSATEFRRAPVQSGS